MGEYVRYVINFVIRFYNNYSNIESDKRKSRVRGKT